MCYIAVDIGMKHFAYAVFEDFNTEQSSFNPRVIDFNIIELKNDLINDLIEWFNNFENPLGSEVFVKTVIIEQQVKNNIKALIIQNIIMTICKLKGIDYYVFNPKLKFKLMNESIKLNYKERKQKSIDYVLMYFNKYNLIDLKLKFMRFIKKDDVADALNMGLMYLYGLKGHGPRDFTEISKKIIEVYRS